MLQDFFKDAVVAGIPLLILVIGLVQWIKDYGLQGKNAKLASLLIGLLLGFGYNLSVKIPVNFADWFTVLVFGLGLGVVASGIYDVANKKTE